MRSGWVTTGPKARAFEQAFTDYLGGNGLQSIAVNSATAGLHLALEALGIGPGDEVIAPTLTFTATVEVVRYLGADPVLVDVEPVTLNIDPEAIRAAITPRTKAIMPVHYGGLACDMDAILAIARAHGLKVVEDAAHALPTTWQGRLVGQLDSDVTVFSFYANKTITTGEGGMVVVRDDELAKRIKVMRLHGISRDAFDRFTAKVPSWYYEIVAPGFKYNLTDIAAALGIHQLKRAREFQQRVAVVAEDAADPRGALLDRVLEEPAANTVDHLVGLARGLVRPLGYLDAYLSRTGFRIVPVVATVEPDFALTLNPGNLVFMYRVGIYNNTPINDPAISCTGERSSTPSAWLSGSASARSAGAGHAPVFR